MRLRTVKITHVSALFVICLFLFGGCNEESQLHWYKGNLHTHSYWSDGDEFPEMVMDWYKTHGYNFVALSDHNILAEGDKWIRIMPTATREEGYQKYLDKYGDQWVNHKADSGRTLVKLKTYKEYKYLFEDDNFLIIQSEEITDHFGDKPIHLNATNIKKLIEPQGGTSVADVMQRDVDAVLEQRKETGLPILPHLNHPNFGYAVSVADLIALHGERFFEVYNGHPAVHNDGDSLHKGTEMMWDQVNIAYSQRSQPLLYGLATDDTHNYHLFGPEYSNAGRGWVMVHAETLTAASLIKALEAGQFYATTGVTLRAVTFKNDVLHIEVEAEDGVTYRIEFIAVVSNGTPTALRKVVEGTEAEFKVTREYFYVRARVVSDKVRTNPVQEREMEMAWVQPVTP